MKERSDNWIPCGTRLPEIGVVVDTIIIEGLAIRNDQPLKRGGTMTPQQGQEG